MWKTCSNEIDGTEPGKTEIGADLFTDVAILFISGFVTGAIGVSTEAAAAISVSMGLAFEIEVISDEQACVVIFLSAWVVAEIPPCDCGDNL